MIPKPGKSEKRPLGVGSPRDKIIQKALSVILEAIWEKEFLDSSYGFRPGKSLHQALYKLHRNGSQYQWVIQGDISKCFDQIPHQIIRELIEKKVQCQKTLQLINKSLSAGYIDPETNEHLTPPIGTPQGSVLSPLLSNIVLHELDLFMDKVSNKFTQGISRAKNPEYSSLQSRIQWLQKSKPGSPEIKELVKQRRKLPSSMATDPGYKRLMYVRYADDFIILIAGSKNDAELIKNWVKSALIKKCGLSLNEEKTIISNTKDGFKFLGADCIKPNSLKSGYFVKTKSGTRGRYRMRMRILVPMKDLIQKLITPLAFGSSGKGNKFVKNNAKGLPIPTARRDLTNLSHLEILNFYNHRIQGILNFYSFAGNYSKLSGILYLLKFSCALTLALKHKLRTKRATFKKFGKYLTDPETSHSLKYPSSLKVKHEYSGYKNKTSEIETLPDKVLDGS
jgi:group II intron reverse transcriptase/maturase